METFDEAVAYIEQIPMFGVVTDGRHKSGNPNLEFVLAELSEPQNRHRAIHVAGTNGKGSTVSFIKSILTAKGYRVGAFTSPHLLSVTERISHSYMEDGALVSEDISHADFARCFSAVKTACDMAVKKGGQHLSYFEFLFAMACVYYADMALDYVLFETGLGGRLDATNVLTPVLTVITSIGLEHTRYLGDTIEKIAAEKAGIIKQGVPVVYHTGSVEADFVVEETARTCQAPAINVAKIDYMIDEITDKTIDFSVASEYDTYSGLRLKKSLGSYQTDNAVTAIAACNCLLKKSLSQDVVQRGLDNFFWQGRMERIGRHLVVDGAHNQNAIEKYVDSLTRCYGNRNVKLLFAVAEDKDYETMIAYLVERLDLAEVYVTSLNSGRAVSAKTVAELFSLYAKKKDKSCLVVAQDDIGRCLRQGLASARRDGDILFAVGSLYLIGSIKEISMEDSHDKF